MPGRIAYLLTAFPTVSETFVEAEFRALMARGFTVDLYATRNFRESAGGEDPLLDRGLTVCRFPYFWSLEVWVAVVDSFVRHPRRTLAALAGTLAGNFRSPRYLLQTVALLPKTLAFARRMRQIGTHHVHGTWGHYPATCAYVVARLLDVPFSFSAHAGLDVLSDSTFLASKVQAARFVLACNHGNGRLLAEQNPGSAGRIHVVHHGVTLSEIPPAGSIPRADPPEIVSVGRLAPEKGFLDLLEACAALRGRGVRFRLRIFGEGPQRPQLDREIRRLELEQVARLEGVVPHAKIVEAAARATVAVLASNEGPQRYLDGIANVLVEAMACGTPVISTQYPGARELLQDGALGVLVPQRDREKLAEALEGILGDSVRRRELGERGRRRVLEAFDRERNMERIAELFRASINAAPSLPAKALPGRPRA